MTLSRFRGLRPLIPPAVEPVSAAEVRAHLKIDAADEDALIAAHIKGARCFAENWLDRALIMQSWTLILDGWEGLPLVLPRGPARSVSAIRVIGDDGAFVAVSPSSWRLADGAGILCASGEGLPSPALSPGGIEIDYAAGFGAGAGDVPDDLRHAVLLLAALGVETRLPVAANAVPPAVTALLSPYRRMRL